MPQKTLNETSFCNMALSAAGAKNLIGDVNTNEDSEEWRMCNLFMWQAIFEIQMVANWRFATERVGLAASTTSPAFGPYKYKAELPSGLLAIQFEVDQYSDETHYKYKREGNFILTNNNPCYILYTQKVENLALFPPVYTKAAYTNLAILMRNKLKGADEWFLRLNRELKDIIADAIGAEAIQDYVMEGNEDVVSASGAYDRSIIDGRPCEC